MSMGKMLPTNKKSIYLLIFFVLLLFLYSIPYIFINPFGITRNWHYNGPVPSLPAIHSDQIVFARLNVSGDIVVHYLKKNGNQWEQLQEFTPNDFHSYNLEAIHFNDRWLVLVARNTLSTYPLRFLINVGTESDLYPIDKSKERWDTLSYFIYEKKNSLWEYARTIDTMRSGDFHLQFLSNDILFYDDMDTSSKKVEVCIEELSKPHVEEKIRLVLPDKLLSRFQADFYQISISPNDENSLLVFDYNTAFSDVEKEKYQITGPFSQYSHGDGYYFHRQDNEWQFGDSFYHLFITNNELYKNRLGKHPVINGAQWVSEKEIALIEAIPEDVKSLNQALGARNNPNRADLIIEQDNLTSPVYLFNIDEQGSYSFDREITYEEFYQQYLSNQQNEKEIYFSFDKKGNISGLYEYYPDTEEKNEIFQIP